MTIPTSPILRTKLSLLPEGVLIGWKKCNDDVLVKLQIPAEARRSNGTERKCRAEFVDVLEVHGAEFGVTDSYGPVTEYRVGERIFADAWDEDWKNVCSNGIHFFITRQEAESQIQQIQPKSPWTPISAFMAPPTSSAK